MWDSREETKSQQSVKKKKKKTLGRVPCRFKLQWSAYPALRHRPSLVLSQFPLSQLNLRLSFLHPANCLPIAARLCLPSLPLSSLFHICSLPPWLAESQSLYTPMAPEKNTLPQFTEQVTAWQKQMIANCLECRRPKQPLAILFSFLNKLSLFPWFSWWTRFMLLHSIESVSLSGSFTLQSSHSNQHSRHWHAYSGGKAT